MAPTREPRGFDSACFLPAFSSGWLSPLRLLDLHGCPARECRLTGYRRRPTGSGGMGGGWEEDRVGKQQSQERGRKAETRGERSRRGGQKGKRARNRSGMRFRLVVREGTSRQNSARTRSKPAGGLPVRFGSARLVAGLWGSLDRAWICAFTMQRMQPARQKRKRRMRIPYSTDRNAHERRTKQVRHTLAGQLSLSEFYPQKNCKTPCRAHTPSLNWPSDRRGPFADPAAHFGSKRRPRSWLEAFAARDDFGVHGRRDHTGYMTSSSTVKSRETDEGRAREKTAEDGWPVAAFPHPGLSLSWSPRLQDRLFAATRNSPRGRGPDRRMRSVRRSGLIAATYPFSGGVHELPTILTCPRCQHPASCLGRRPT